MGHLLKLKCAHSSLNLRIYLQRVSYLHSRRASANFSPNSHEMDYSVPTELKGMLMLDAMAGQLLI
jgi:hypothetical protein